MNEKMNSIDVFYYSYNQTNFIKRALNSILSQDIDISINLFVCDDASTDNSAIQISQWISENESSISSKKITVSNISNPKNLGQVATLKKGLINGGGAYLAILEGDDYWIRADHLSNSVKILDECTLYSGVFSSWISLNQAGAIMEYRYPLDSNLASRIFDFQYLCRFNAPGTLSCMVYRRSALTQLSSVIAQDIFLSDFSLNLAMATKGLIFWSDLFSVVYTYDPNSLWRRIPVIDQRSMITDIIEDRIRALGLPKSYLEALHPSKLTRITSIFSFGRKHPKQLLVLLIQKILRLR